MLRCLGTPDALNASFFLKLFPQKPGLRWAITLSALRHSCSLRVK